jgi:phenylalanyl-tRNA synthetase beta chain
MLRRPDDGLSVSLSNPATKEFEVCRTSLLPGILKTMRQNRALPVAKGVRLFEISDVVLRDKTNPIGAKNRRRLAALYMGPSAGFAVVHGLVDRVMELVEVDPTPSYNATDPARCILKGSRRQYEIAHAQNPTYLPGQCADIIVVTTAPAAAAADVAGSAPGGGGGGAKAAVGDAAEATVDDAVGSKVIVGTFGIVHPDVLKAFNLEYPCSMLEMDIECFL